MKRNKNILVKSKNRSNTEDAAAFLHKVADKLAEKKIRFAQGETESEVDLPDNILFSVAASEKTLRKKGLRRMIKFQLKWFDGDDKTMPLEVK